MGKHNNAKLKKKSQESSVFTDQDFENFSKEYFGLSDPINKKTSEKKKKKQEDDEYLWPISPLLSSICFFNSFNEYEAVILVDLAEDSEFGLFI